MKQKKIFISVTLALGITHSAFAQFGPSLELGDLNGTNGFTINGVAAHDQSGFSVSSAGDVNGDGLDDLIIGAQRADPGGNSNAGSSYVVFGSSNPLPNPFNLASINGSNGFIINGVTTEDLSGNSVSAAGDINDDGIDDLIIGAYSADPGGNFRAGSSYVVFGSTSDLPHPFNLSSINGSNGIIINGAASLDFSGRSVSAAGDVNGDGIDDLIIGSYGEGRNYVIFGSNSTLPHPFNLSSINGNNGFIINGVATNDLTGLSASAAGDINDDGIDDLIIGAKGADPGGNSSAGSSYVVFGSNSTLPHPFNLSSLDGTNGFTLNGVAADDETGRSVSTAGDINGDGIDDLIIGAHRADSSGNINAGSSYIVFGSNSQFPSSFNLANLDGVNGFIINGVSLADESGWSVSTAGDVNDDGIDDLIIGAPRASPGGISSAGSSYVVFGSNSQFPSTFNLASLDGTNGFIINASTFSETAGGSVSTAGDINGDGIDDLIIGAYTARPNGINSSGSSYVVYGRGDAIFKAGFE